MIENIAGADGILAGKEFAGRRDDHTLLYSFAGLITINPLLYEKLPYGRTVSSLTDFPSEQPLNFLAIAVSGTLNVDCPG